MWSESDARSWTTPGAQDAAQATYASIQAALDQPAVKAFDLQIFLQGSYANHTNTRGDSDVDIVVMMRSSYMPDVSRLGYGALQSYERDRVPGTTTLDGLRDAVTTALQRYYGSARVHPRNKCIRVDKRDGYVDADVVPAMQQRLFTDYPAYGPPSFIEGINIKPLRGARIVNFPKEHIKNGKIKNERCGDLYKPTVRQIKRLRRLAVDRDLLGKKDAPGYVLECLTYNAPTTCFTTGHRARMLSVLTWLGQHSAADLARTMKSCDEIHTLFGTDPGGHSEYTAERVIRTLKDFL